MFPSPLQHCLTAFGGIIAIPLILSQGLCLQHDALTQSHLISTIFFVSGICTLLQVVFGVRWEPVGLVNVKSDPWSIKKWFVFTLIANILSHKVTHLLPPIRRLDKQCSGAAWLIKVDFTVLLLNRNSKAAFICNLCWMLQLLLWKGQQYLKECWSSSIGKNTLVWVLVI